MKLRLIMIVWALFVMVSLLAIALVAEPESADAVRRDLATLENASVCVSR